LPIGETSQEAPASNAKGVRRREYVTIILPNMNAVRQITEEPDISITPQMRELLAYLNKHAEITDVEIQALLGIKKTRSYDLVKRMADAGLVKIIGRGESRKITL
jgi:ATP-dependent DNA helicase RecG